MINRNYLSAFLAIVLTVSVFTVSLPEIGYAGSNDQAVAASDLESRLARIEAKVEKRRKELGIPGLSLAIVKDDKVIYSKGLGYKDFENKVPMTPDTQLAIGSATKAFTGLSVLMLQDDGKLSLDDSPKKYLPYFRINNPETDKNIQVRDLMAHSSGLNRTDLAMITGKLNRVELIKVAGEAKPMAGLRKKFYYQNLMYTAAGQIVAEVEKQPWEDFVPERIFKPLGMNNSTMSVKQMKKASDYSYGYVYNFDTKETRRLPTRDLSEIAPAGSINSSANDMAKWLRFILNGGVSDGKRLVSSEGFSEWIKPQMKITPNGKVAYGLGWFLEEWKGKKVVHHGGNIDGFNSMVALIPEEKLGFVLLTNVSGSPLSNELRQIVWSGMLDSAERSEKLGADAKKEVGKYRFAEAGFDIDVMVEEGNLVAKVPGQPTYILEKVKGRRYKLSNAPDGFFITFKDVEAFLEQPQGNFTLPKIGARKEGANKGDDPAKELLGKYAFERQSDRTVEIRYVDGKASLVVGNQPPYPLRKRDDGNFGSPNLPDTYYVVPKRNGDGKISGFTMVQPNGKFVYKYIGETEKNLSKMISVEDLMARLVTALGGEDNMRKIASRMMEFRLDAIHQGVKGYGKSYEKAPNKFSSRTTLTALGKKIGWANDYFDGSKSFEDYSFAPSDEATGQRLADLKAQRDMYPYLDLEKKLEKAEVVKSQKVAQEDAYVVSIKPKGVTKYTLYVSKKTYLPLRKDMVIVSSTSSQKIPISERYSDYREVDGVKLPFKITTAHPGMGEIISYVTKVKHNVRISDKKFRKK